MCKDMQVIDNKMFREKGYWQSSKVIGDDDIENVKSGIDEILDGFYDTGVEPIDTANEYFDATDTIRDINQVHLANSAISDLVHNAELAKQIAGVTGASQLQVWGSQLFVKPPSLSKKCNIGWHQDYFFHKKQFTPNSDIFTVWIAVSDVENDCGPLKVIPGSNHWGFFDTQSSPREYVQSYIGEEHASNWQEESLIMKTGSFSIHDKLVFHGSYSNLSSSNRVSIALRVRTENSSLKPDAGLDLSDIEQYPIIWQA